MRLRTLACWAYLLLKVDRKRNASENARPQLQGGPSARNGRTNFRSRVVNSQSRTTKAIAIKRGPTTAPSAPSGHVGATRICRYFDLSVTGIKDPSTDYNPSTMKSPLKWTLPLLALLALAAVVLPHPVSVDAGPAAQAPTPFTTPTPNADGEIIYTVKEGDTAWRVAAIAGITLEELYALNGLQDTDFLREGQQLLLGRVQPPQPTPDPDEAPTEPAATATPEQGSGEICALLFEDGNGNARLDESETPLNGGQVSVADGTGQVVGESVTAEQIVDEELVGVCFADLEEGDYNVSGAVPEGYNPTTSMNTPVRLRPGEVKFVEFGAQASAATLDNPSEGGGRSTLLGLLGVALLVAAAALGYYATSYGRSSSRGLR